jgi:ribosomal 50S subunit-associated protein YjgA (DUF615 family)
VTRLSLSLSLSLLEDPSSEEKIKSEKAKRRRLGWVGRP